VLGRCWLGGRKGIQTVKTSWWGTGMVISGVRCKWFAYGSADATTTPSSVAPVKSRSAYLFGAILPRLSSGPGKRHLNGCSNSSSSLCCSVFGLLVHVCQFCVGYFNFVSAMLGDWLKERLWNDLVFVPSGTQDLMKSVNFGCHSSIQICYYPSA